MRSSKMITICPWCKEKFETYRVNPQKFCGVDCYKAYNRNKTITKRDRKEITVGKKKAVIYFPEEFYIQVMDYCYNNKIKLRDLMRELIEERIKNG